MMGHIPTAGYNTTSYQDMGRQEPVKGGYDEEEAMDEPFDIYADFNNQGPRYSTALGSLTQNDSGYRQVHSPALVKTEEEASTVGGAPVEMVTVPALGPEWKASELRDMTGKGKREAGREARALKWKEWRRGERGLCGKYFTGKFTAWFLFGLCCVVGLILAFTIPRVPGFQFNSNTPLIAATPPFNNTIPTLFSRAPANFSFPAFADLEADTGSNYLPLTFNNIHTQVFDLNTGRQVGSGDSGHFTIPAKSFPRIQLPLNFTYIATNDSDQTWANWYNACKNKAIYNGGNRPPIQFKLLLNMDIKGLIGNHVDGTQVTDAPCPIELAINAA